MSPGRAGMRDASVELDLRRLVGALGRLEVRPVLEAREVRDDDRRARTAKGVVGLRHVVEAAALDRDAVLGPLELRLQVSVILVGLQLGILLDRDEQPADRRTELILRLLELLEGRRILDGISVELDLSSRGARLDDLREGFFFEVRRALDGLDEVRDEVGPALVDVLHLGPARADGLVGRVQLVVGDRRDAADDENADQNEDDAAESYAFTHRKVVPPRTRDPIRNR